MTIRTTCMCLITISIRLRRQFIKVEICQFSAHSKLPGKVNYSHLQGNCLYSRRIRVPPQLAWNHPRNCQQPPKQRGFQWAVRLNRNPQGNCVSSCPESRPPNDPREYVQQDCASSLVAGFKTVPKLQWNHFIHSDLNFQNFQYDHKLPHSWDSDRQYALVDDFHQEIVGPKYLIR